MENIFEKIKKALSYSLSHPEDREDALIDYKNSRAHDLKKRPACLAPWTSINFTIDGHANVCCLNRTTSVGISGKTIDQIWKSASFENLRNKVLKDDLSYDCSVCKEQIEARNFSGVKAANYDVFFPPDLRRPKVMEFCLDNTCNLGCVMCNSVLSSTIRKNQKLPPFKSLYTDEFIDQLDDYIPHLESIVFSGGEPFLIPFYYKIWEKIHRLNPDLVIHVVTNGTRLDDKIKNLLERGRFQLNISLDAVDKKVYESIRVNAAFDDVMKNFLWFRDYGRRKDLRVNIPVCALTSNWKNIPEIVRFANENDVSMNFVYVDRPISLTLVNKKPEFLSEIIDYYKAQKFEFSTFKSKENVQRFQGLINDIEKWKEKNMNSSAAILSQDKEDNFEIFRNAVMQSDAPTLRDNDDAKREFLKQIEDMLNHLPKEKHPLIFERLRSTPLSVIHSYTKGRKMEEMLKLFNEYTGTAS